jgi:hypothetical protein
MKLLFVVMLMLPSIVLANSKPNWVKVGTYDGSVISYDVATMVVKGVSSAVVNVRTVHRDKSYNKDKYVVECCFKSLKLLSHYAYTRSGISFIAVTYPVSSPKLIEYEENSALEKLRAKVCESADENILSDLTH